LEGLDKRVGIKEPPTYRKICQKHIFPYVNSIVNGCIFLFSQSFFMIIAIGTTSSPKVAGVQEAINVCPYFDDNRGNIEYILEKVPSDVADMPLSLEVTLE